MSGPAELVPATTARCGHEGFNGALCAMMAGHKGPVHLDYAYGEHWNCAIADPSHAGACDSRPLRFDPAFYLAGELARTLRALWSKT